MSPELKGLLETAFRGRTLGREGARRVMGLLMEGEASQAQIGGLLGAVEARGAMVEELAGFVEAMRERAVRVECSREPLIDTCGTGGDGLATFNFSTAAALVAAGAGVAVAKHGNRAVSSQAGSADVLEALGVPIDLGPEAAREALDQAGFAFLFAPLYHPAMKAVGAARRALGVRTVFNVLGPLANPAGVKRQVVGVYEAALQEKVASVLLELGAQRALVARGADGMDELSPCGETLIVRAEAGRGLWTETVTPELAGTRRVEPAEVAGGNARGNARALLRLLEGDETGALLEGTVLNAGAALVAAGKARDFRQGADAARECVRSGRAREVLERLLKFKKEESE